MTSHPSAQIVRGRKPRTVAEFSPAFVWEATDSTSPLHGSLVGSKATLAASVVVSDGKRMIVALRSELVTA